MGKGEEKKKKPDFCCLCGAPGVLVAGAGGWKWSCRDIGTQKASMLAETMHGETQVMAVGLAATRLSCHPLSFGSKSAWDTAR